MRVHQAIWLLAAAALIGGGVAARAQADAPVSPVALDQAFQSLYKTAASGLVHLTITQSAMSVMDDDLKKDFQTWRADQGSRGGRPGGRGPGGGGGPPPGAGAGGGQGPGGGFGGGGGGGGGRGGGGGGGGFNQANLSSQVTNFLRSKAEQLEKQAATSPDKEKDLKQEAARLRGLALRVELNRNGFQGEMSAVVIDKDNHALLLTGLVREAHPDPFPVTLPDGTETTGRYVGASPGGFTVIALAKINNAKPATWTKRHMVPGQLLLTLPAGQGMASLMLASGRTGSGNIEDHLAVPADERGGMFLFDSAGNLAAVLLAGGFQGEHRVLTGERMERDIKYILGAGSDGKTGRDIEPRALGLGYVADKGPVHRGVIITSVDAQSLGGEAGLKKDDLLVSIDGKPVTELVSPDARPLVALIQMQVDFATRTGSVPLVIVRDGKEQTLQMPLN